MNPHPQLESMATYLAALLSIKTELAGAGPPELASEIGSVLDDFLAALKAAQKKRQAA